MALTPNSEITPQTPNNAKVVFTNANATNPVGLYNSGSNGSKIVGVIITSTDNVSHDFQLSIQGRSGGGNVVYPLGTVSVPIGAGNSGSVPSVNALNNAQFPGLPVDSDGNPYLILVIVGGVPDVLEGTLLTAIAGSGTVTVNIIAADF